MFIALDRTSKTPMIRQIYKAVRQDILSGAIAPAQRLPSSRELAQSLAISRNVVLEAYDQLAAEGYIEMREGAGTFAAQGAVFVQVEGHCSNKSGIVGLRFEIDKGLIDFRTGVPDLKQFPIGKWGQLYKRICADLAAHKLDYYDPRGCYDLRWELCQYLHKTRGVVCNPDQMLITTGAAQGFSLSARVLLNSKEHVVVEDPINKDIYKTLMQTGATVHPIAVDDSGMVTDELPAVSPKLIFTTPSHQFPMGGILPINRRITLINYARQSNGFILEDDYDSEFRFQGAPISSFQSLDPDRVIYIGTFSKILFPALRIGYLILPNALVPRFNEAKHLEDLHSPALEQLTLAQFLRDGLLDRHVALLKKQYQRRNAALKTALLLAFGDRIKIVGSQSGIHLVVEFWDICFNQAHYERLIAAGVRVSPIDEHVIQKGLYANRIMLGYGNLTEEQIAEGVKRMKEVL